MDKPRRHRVKGTAYAIHNKQRKPPSLCIKYSTDQGAEIWEFVCPEHVGFAQEKFAEWWRLRSTCPVPETVHAAWKLAWGGALARAITIYTTVDPVSGYDRIDSILTELGPRPTYTPRVQEAQTLPDLDEDLGEPDFLDSIA